MLLNCLSVSLTAQQADKTDEDAGMACMWRGPSG